MRSLYEMLTKALSAANRGVQFSKNWSTGTDDKHLNIALRVIGKEVRVRMCTRAELGGSSATASCTVMYTSCSDTALPSDERVHNNIARRRTCSRVSFECVSSARPFSPLEVPLISMHDLQFQGLR